jgi:hypothetical protein
MKRVLLVGYDPKTVDFSDPALPPGMTVEKVHAGIAVAMKQFADRGWEEYRRTMQVILQEQETEKRKC